MVPCAGSPLTGCPPSDWRPTCFALAVADSRAASPDARATGRSTARRTASSVPTRISSRRARVTAV